MRITASKYESATTSAQRARGAMFRGALQNTALVFVYPVSSRRIFHTFFCKPLRIVAFNEIFDVVLNKVVKANRFISIPRSRYIFEVDAAAEFDLMAFQQEIRRVEANRIAQPESGNWGKSVDLHKLITAFLEQTNLAVPQDCWNRDRSCGRLLWVLVATAVADMRQVQQAFSKQSSQETSKILSQGFTVHRRGTLLASAAFLLHAQEAIQAPEKAVRLAQQVVKAEVDRGYTDELLAASIAGAPFHFTSTCIRCGRNGSWRSVLVQPPGMPDELAWRYERPENHVPCCSTCAATVPWARSGFALASGIWGMRFEALLR